MPDYTITLSPKAIQRLKILMQRTNETEGTSLTLRDWITLHLRELAIGPDLSAAIPPLQEQTKRDAEATLQAAIIATRDQLLQEL